MPRDGRAALRRWAPYAAVYAAGVLSAVLVIGIGANAASTGRIREGTTIAGKSMGDLDADDAAKAIGAYGDELAAKPITLFSGDKEVVVEPSKIGFRVDVAATVAAAMAAGEGKTAFEAVALWLRGGARAVPLVVAIDEAAFDKSAAEWETQVLDDAAFDGGITVEAGRAVAQMPRAGTGIDKPALRERIATALAKGVGEPIEIPKRKTEPRLGPAEVNAALARANELLAGPIVLTREATGDDEPKKAEAPRPEPTKKRKKKRKNGDEAEAAPAPVDEKHGGPIELRFAEDDLAAALRTRTELEPAPRLVVELDPKALTPALERISKRLEDPARDARFTFDEKDQVTIVPSRDGTRVDPAKVAEALSKASSTKERRGELPVDLGAKPALSTEDAKALGIKGLVAQFSTQFQCCQPRVKNIKRIAELMDGVIVKPGDRFSVNELIGPRTSDRGFVLAPSIEEGEMVDTVGGGVSQFATTFYNVLLDGGYAILERKPHSIWFSRYPMGHEATLSFPKPDLVFRNDTAAGVVVKTEMAKTYVKVKLYGDNGGRRVERRVSGRFDIKEPPNEYVANDSLDSADEDVKEGGQAGWSLDVGRIITMPDGTKKEETRRVKYRARPRVVEVHSCKIPKNEKGHTGKKCPESKLEDGEEKPTEGGTDSSGIKGDQIKREDPTSMP
jgi:vancomycin resistance protein YoaR